MIDTAAVRRDFPIFGDGQTVYFDNAATSQRPACVLEAVESFYRKTNANPLRGLYAWSVGATEAYEAARHKVARFLGAREDSEIVFTRK